MKSKNGKKELCCPNCASSNISKLKFMGDKIGMCISCWTYWPWSQRMKKVTI